MSDLLTRLLRDVEVLLTAWTSASKAHDQVTVVVQTNPDNVDFAAADAVLDPLPVRDQWALYSRAAVLMAATAAGV